MKNLRIQNGCHNCRHVFVYYEYDEHDRYYCAFDGINRPPSPSVAMEEVDEITTDVFDKFDQWAKGRNVDRECICDNWEKQ